MSDDPIDTRLADELERFFYDEPPTAGWDDVLRRAAPRKDLATARPTPARATPPRRSRRLALAAILVIGLVPAAVLARAAWDLVIGDPAPAPVQHAIADFQRLPARVSRALRFDPAKTRIVARVDTTRGPVYYVAGPTLPREFGRPGRAAVEGQCAMLLIGFPFQGQPGKSVTFDGRRYFFNSISCGGKAPPGKARPVESGGWQLVDEHLSVAFGHLTGSGHTLQVVRANGSRSTVSTWHGYFAVAKDDGVAGGSQVVAAEVRDEHGRVVAHPFLVELATPLPAESSHPLIGTSVFNARVFPGDVALGRETVLRSRPRFLVVEFQNSGSVTIHGAITVTVRVGGRVYRRVARNLVPGVTRSVRVELPADLPVVTVISADTSVLPGEGNPSNNHKAWRVRIPR